MAGTAYIKEMYDRYGSPGFLAAYNAGPNRLDSYLANGTPLPDETVGYLSNIAPRLGTSTALSGPLAVYAGTPGYGTTPYAPVSSAPPPVVLANASPGSCDPDAAYDPTRACAPLPPAPSPYAPVAPVRPVVVASAPAGSCDPDAAYDPRHPCAPLPQAPAPAPIVTASSVYVPPPPAAPQPPVVFSPAPRSRPAVQLASLSVGRPTGSWGIQVGAFLDPAVARAAAAGARRAAPELLSQAAIDLPPTAPFGGAVLYRARLDALTPEAAAQACARLTAGGTACLTVPPGRLSDDSGGAMSSSDRRSARMPSTAATNAATIISAAPSS